MVLCLPRALPQALNHSQLHGALVYKGEVERRRPHLRKASAQRLLCRVSRSALVGVEHHNGRGHVLQQIAHPRQQVVHVVLAV